jgi:hypothetical protein
LEAVKLINRENFCVVYLAEIVQHLKAFTLQPHNDSNSLGTKTQKLNQLEQNIKQQLPALHDMLTSRNGHS